MPNTKIDLAACHSKLSSVMYLGLANKPTIRQLLVNFLSMANTREIELKLPKLLEKKKIREALTASSKTINDFSVDGFLIDLPLPKILLLYRELCIAFKPQLSRFVELRAKLENALMFAKHKDALAFIEEIEAENGESIWSSRTKMLILASMDDNEAFKDYCDYCQKESKGFNSFIFKASQLIADSGNATLHLANVVHRTIAELQEAKKYELSSLLQILFNPYPLVDDIDHTACLPYLQALPIIDLYSCIIEIAKIELVQHDEESSHQFQLKELCQQIADVIDDPVLRALCDVNSFVVAGPRALKGNPLEMYLNYKSGKYESALISFRKCEKSDDSALSLINLAGKSMAYLEKQKKSVEIYNIAELNSGMPVLSIASDLSIIYGISPLWEQSEEQITSIAIKYNHLQLSAGIKIALMKALPHSYNRKLQSYAARLAIISLPFSTPQTYQLAITENSLLEVFDAGDDIPEYRKLKNTIKRRLVKADEDEAVTRELLDDLKKSEALEKDVIECYVDFFIKAEHDMEMLKMASNQLTHDTNRHICFPMENLVDIVESRHINDLDAVIICHHYNSNISEDRNDLLNEVFEEYLLAAGVSRPSQLLLNIECLEERDKRFFRDICVPDVMDYLGCFKNSNELRKERITILDGLQERNVITPKERMREVEAIVRQVIVDTGTSEFNNAKIFVNESNLQKKITEEISTLIIAYKKMPEESEERYASVNHEMPNAIYLSGNKNNMIEKIYAIVAGAYLFDEKYGLDKNLSGEIRHGFFSNLMRARLEEQNLLTEQDEKGEYLPNLFWRENNSLLTENFWKIIDDILKSFSRSFDLYIAEAEGWMKILFQTDGEDRIFKFHLTTQDIDQIKDILSITEESDYLITFIFSILSSKTDVALSNMRERLNGEFKTKIDQLFETTYNSISTAKGDAALLELMQCLTRARNEIKEEIHTASLWFQKNENTEIYAGTLDRLLEIAVRSFEKVRGNVSIINLKTPIEFQEVPVNSQNAKSFILAIINLLDNCYSHSGLRGATQVSINGSLENNIAHVVIVNNLSQQKQTHLDSDVVALICEKLTVSDLSSQIRGEGGTGLIKASHEISFLGAESHLSISRIKDNFLAEITYNFSNIHPTE
jgi:hypothetical protein